MPKLRISGALQYLLWFLGRNEKNKCGGVPKWLNMVGNLKKKKWIVQKDQVKKKRRKEKGLEQKKKKWKRKKKKEKNRSAIWTLLCKVSGIDIIWKEKLCSTSL